MAIVLAGLVGWLFVLMIAISLGAAAKRGDELARAAFGRPLDDRSAVPSQRRARERHGLGATQRLTRPTVDRCGLCGAQR
jgi:hypothetical protein